MTSDSKTEAETNLKVENVCSFGFDMLLFAKIGGCAALLALINIAIPLGMHGDINEIAFLVFHFVYGIGAFNMSRYTFELSAPGLSTFRFAFSFIVGTTLTLLFYILYFFGVIDVSLGYIRTTGANFMVFFIVIIYLIHSIDKDKSEMERKLSMGSFDKSINLVTTASPLRELLSLSLASYPRKDVSDSENTVTDSISDADLSVPSSQHPTSGAFVLTQDMCGCAPTFEDMKCVRIIGLVVHQWARSLFMLLCVTAAYMYCQWLSLFFYSAEGAFGEVGVYLMFVISFLVIRPVARHLGFLVDQHKTGGPSMEVLMELTISVFYYTFYRNLFISVHSYRVFFIMKSIHVLSEAVNFTVCFSSWYRSTLRYLFERWKDSPLRMRLLVVFTGSHTPEVSIQRQCIRAGMKLYVFLYTALVFMIFFVFLRYGYNKNFYCLYSELSPTYFIKLMNITIMSVVIELLLFWYTDALCVLTYQRGILTIWQKLLSGKLGIPNQAFTMYMIWCLAHVTTDIYLSRLDVASVGGIDCPDIE